MKKTLARILLILGYCIPFVFLAMNEDATTGTLWFYLIMVFGFGILCYSSLKIRSVSVIIAGNVLSFISSCIFAYAFQTEKWEYYFKPFVPNQLIIFETIIAFAIQLIFTICFIKKKQADKTNNNIKKA